MNHQDKQLTSFLGMTIGSALDDYMSNLANKYQESEQKTAAIEENLLLVKQEKNKFDQLIKERDKRILDLGVQLRQKDNELAAVRKKLEKTEADLMLANTKTQEMQDDKNRLLELEEQAESKRLEDELKKKDSELMARKVKVMNTSGQPVPMGRKQCWQCHHISFTQSTYCEKCGIRDWWIS